MEFVLPINIPPLKKQISYREGLFLVGSCFTEHIGDFLKDLKFPVLQNPHGIVFDPWSVSRNLLSYVDNRRYSEADLTFFHEMWHSWNHHSCFSDISQEDCLRRINAAQEKAHDFLGSARWLFITLGTSYSYRLAENNQPVANCHRAPAQMFTKHMMTIEEIHVELDNCIHQLKRFNDKLELIFTVSPVRHIRDGVVNNNRSKARLIEVVHHLVNKFDGIHYFPAYELMIDILRDHRFYDLDMVHPNYQATSYILERFAEFAIDWPSRELMEEIKKIKIARGHRAFQPDTQAHRNFLKSHAEKVMHLMSQYPFLDLEEELAYFSGH